MGTLRLGDRIQAFSLFLRSVDGLPLVRCVSPVGSREWATTDDIGAGFSEPAVRVCAVYNQALVGYEFAAEGDVLLWNGSDAQRPESTL